MTAGSNAQYMVTVRTPQTTGGTTKINVTQNRGAGTEYVIRCYDTRDMSCYGDERGNVVSSNGTVEIYMSLGRLRSGDRRSCRRLHVLRHRGRDLCLRPYYQCEGVCRVRTHGRYVYADKGWVAGGVACRTGEFASDPVPNKVKACFYKIIQQ